MCKYGKTFYGFLFNGFFFPPWDVAIIRHPKGVLWESKNKKKNKKKVLWRCKNLAPKKRLVLCRRVLKNKIKQRLGALEESLQCARMGCAWCAPNTNYIYCVMTPSVIFVSFSSVLNWGLYFIIIIIIISKNQFHYSNNYQRNFWNKFFLHSPL